MTYFTNSIANVTFLLTVVNATLSMSTVIGQATVVELSKEKGNDSKNLISLYSFFKFVGVLCSSFFKGFLVEKFSIRVVFVVASILPLVLFVSGLMLVEKRYGYLEKEEKLINTNETHKEDSLFHKLIVFYCQKKILIPTSFIIFLLWAPPGYEQPLFYFNSEALHFTPKDFGYLFLWDSTTLHSSINSVNLSKDLFNDLKQSLRLFTIFITSSLIFSTQSFTDLTILTA